MTGSSFLRDRKAPRRAAKSPRSIPTVKRCVINLAGYGTRVKRRTPHSERGRRPQVRPRYEEVANFYCGVCKGWGRVTQKVRRSRILPANSCRVLKNLDVHDTNGYLQKAQESSRNRNIVYRLGERNAREKRRSKRQEGREMGSMIKKMGSAV